MEREPERYYDWMVWKMRQEDNAMRQPTINEELEAMRHNVKDMQACYYSVLNRVKELSEENEILKQQLNELRNTTIPLR